MSGFLNWESYTFYTFQTGSVWPQTALTLAESWGCSFKTQRRGVFHLFANWLIGQASSCKWYVLFELQFPFLIVLLLFSIPILENMYSMYIEHQCVIWFWFVCKRNKAGFLHTKMVTTGSWTFRVQSLLIAARFRAANHKAFERYCIG